MNTPTLYGGITAGPRMPTSLGSPSIITVCLEWGIDTVLRYLETAVLPWSKQIR
ncbi:hypothetical protein ACQ9LF_01585 [Anaerohalosphaeraceae bacterium U12dextr]